jgi:glycosyltransferase involved in cell wall biosynthesis
MISVVIPALDEEGYIEGLLSDLYHQTRRPEEIIVVDGGSKDGTKRAAESFPGVTLLSSHPPVARQRNAGIKAAKCEFLFFLDADVHLEEDFLEKFLVKFEAGLDVACPLYMPPEASNTFVKAIHLLLNGLFIASTMFLASGSGQCIAVRRELLRKGGGFDERLKFADDIELIRRLSREGRFVVLPHRITVSDRRFREQGILRSLRKLLFMSVLFTAGRFEWTNLVEYRFGQHEKP